MNTRRMLRAAAAAVLVAGGAVTAVPAAASDAGGTGRPVFVSSGGAGGASGRGGCATTSIHSITAGVAAAPSGGTVIVCPGTYHEDVVVQKPLNLRGQDATVDASALENGFQVVSDNVTLSGFTVQNANGEGVLVGIDSLNDIGLLPTTGPVISGVTVADNHVVSNNKGFNGTENANCKYPGDCGGGIHFNVTSRSVMRDNVVTGNVDGVLLTDDYGPNSYNLVTGNVVDRNVDECGITLPSHSSTAVSFDPQTFAVTGVNPTNGGVYNNTVVGNVADDNGTAPAPPQFGGGGSGAGIGLFASGPGSAVYNNLVAFNEASGNGLSGVTIHAHAPGGSDVDGNRIVFNALGTNNLLGDPFDPPPAPHDFNTTGIAIYSASPARMEIAGNRVHDDFYGIWISKIVTATGLQSNRFENVAVPVFQNA